MSHDLNQLPPKRHLLKMRDRIEKCFTAGNWREVAIITGFDYITKHSRLLRSLSFGDPDYTDCILDVLDQMYNNSPLSIFDLEEYLDQKFPESIEGENISSIQSDSRKIVFVPAVFQIPTAPLDPDLVSVMMPFDAAFDHVYEAIGKGIAANGLKYQRVSDIWEHSTIIQDIFSLIFRSVAVICDFSGKNPNVFYEAGIAHTLGKHVIPITQNGSDIPFDLSHHRYLSYLNNAQGLGALQKGISERLWSLGIPF